ncbi:kinesin-like protein KIN-12B [Tanacetum coccineum]
MLINKCKVEDRIEDIIKATARAGVKGAESRFIKVLALKFSTLKVEREKERKIFRDENKGLQEQLRDTAEAVEAAGELLVRLKEAEEAVAAAQVRYRFPTLLAELISCSNGSSILDKFRVFIVKIATRPGKNLEKNYKTKCKDLFCQNQMKRHVALLEQIDRIYK